MLPSRNEYVVARLAAIKSAVAAARPPQHKAESRADESATLFRQQGFVRMDALVKGEVLSELIETFARAQHRARIEWQRARRAQEGWAAQGYFDIPSALSEMPALLALLEQPRLVALLQEVIGPQVTLIHVQARTVLPESEGGDYFGLHRDTARSASGLSSGLPDHPSQSEHVKLFVALNRHSQRNGATSVVGGTHRIQTNLSEERPISYPGMQVFDGRSGDAMLMDLRTIHGALPNRSKSETREGLVRVAAAAHTIHT